jgi:hypothetical protein
LCSPSWGSSSAVKNRSRESQADFFLPESYWRIPETKNGQPVYARSASVEIVRRFFAALAEESDATLRDWHTLPRAVY